MNVLDKKLQNSIWDLSEIFDDRQISLVTFVNPFSYNWLSNQLSILTSMDYIFADGALLVRLNNLFYNKATIGRYSFDFSSIADDSFSYFQEQELNVAFVGATEIEVSKAVANISSLYPELKVCYTRSGYFDEEIDMNTCIKDVISSQAQVLIVGMGSPYQEEFALAVKSALKLGDHLRTIITCGGFLTQTSIRKDYYPIWVKKTGLRWLYRFLTQKHVRKKVVTQYPRFLFSYCLTGIKYSFHRVCRSNEMK